MTAKLHVLGAGGHSAVVCDAARLMDQWTTIVVYDDATPNTIPADTEYGGPFSQAIGKFSGQEVCVALGAADTRIKLCGQLLENGAELVTIQHPNAVVADGVELGVGTVVCAGAIINVGCVVGTGSIINTGAIADHDCTLGVGVHLCPGVTLAGRVRIGDHSWIGVGAAVRDGITIGMNTLIGAGATVVNDIPSNSRAFGCPARLVTRDEVT